MRGDISINVLNYISLNEQNLLKLADVISVANMQNWDCPRSEVLECSIRTRKEEYRYFSCFKDKLLFFVSFLSDCRVVVKG